MSAQEQKAFFEDQGYLIIEDLLTEQEIDTCQREIERLHQLAAQLQRKGELAASNFQCEPFITDANGEVPILRKIEQTRTHSAVFRQLSAHPKLIATVQTLLGDDLLLFRSTLMLKPAHHGSAHALHQDSAYWPIDPPALVTVSIALSDATLENGCIKVIPGSHKWGLQEWGGIAQKQDAPLTQRDDLDLSAQIDVPLKAGSVLFFHSLMAHGSGANTTPHPRNTALYAYFSPHVRYTPNEKQATARTFPVVAGLNGSEEFTLTATATNASQ